jgi:hypothetical protein
VAITAAPVLSGKAAAATVALNAAAKLAGMLRPLADSHRLMEQQYSAIS